MNLITDRTKSDVLLGTEKGRYGFEDLNRVETAVAYLAPLVGLELETKTDWGLPGKFSTDQWPTKSQMLRYLMNVKYLCSASLEAIPPLPESMDNLDWKGANQIEQALERVYKAVGNINNVLGDAVLGEMYLGG